MTKKKRRGRRKTNLSLEVEYSPKRTDPESLAHRGRPAAGNRTVYAGNHGRLRRPDVWTVVGSPVRAILFAAAIRSRAKVFPHSSCRTNCRVKRWEAIVAKVQGCCISIWTELAANSGIGQRMERSRRLSGYPRMCCSNTVWFPCTNKIALQPATESPATSAAELVSWAAVAGLVRRRTWTTKSTTKWASLRRTSTTGPVRTDRFSRSAVRRCSKPVRLLTEVISDKAPGAEQRHDHFPEKQPDRLSASPRPRRKAGRLKPRQSRTDFGDADSHWLQGAAHRSGLLRSATTCGNGDFRIYSVLHDEGYLVALQSDLSGRHHRLRAVFIPWTI